MSWEITVQAHLAGVSGAAVRRYLAEAAPGAQPSPLEEFDDGDLLRQAVEDRIREFLAGLGVEGRCSVIVRRQEDETRETAGDVHDAIREEHPRPVPTPAPESDLKARRLLGEELAEGKD